MACQLLANFFAWGLEHEKQQPTLKLGLSTFTFRSGPKGHTPQQVLAGGGSGDLFYSPEHIVKVGLGRGNLIVPASFAGEIKYIPEGRGSTENVNVQIIAFGNNFSVTFHPPTAPINGGFVPSCSPVPLGTLAGTLTGFTSDLLVMMHLTEA
jgi:hypothetical protein